MLPYERRADPKWWQCLLCVLIILSLEALLIWLDNDGPQAFFVWVDSLPAEDLRFALLAVPLALVAGLIGRRLRGGMR